LKTNVFWHAARTQVSVEREESIHTISKLALWLDAPRARFNCFGRNSENDDDNDRSEKKKRLYTKKREKKR